MVDPDHIVEAESMAQPVHPPAVAGLFMIVPPVNGIPPQLARFGKGIRRTARYHSRVAVFIKFKKLRMTPGIRAVKGHIDWQIAYNTNPLLIGVFFQLCPLAEEHILLELYKTDMF